MKIMTFNANGIRSAVKKGFFSWLSKQKVDVVCIQETKAQEHQLSDPAFCPEDYHCFYADAEKKGYSGVALYTAKKPDKVTVGFGYKLAESEGRYIQADFGNLSIVSLYMPSGTSGDYRQKIKYEFMDEFFKHLKKILKSGREFIIAGDWNIAHKEIDLKNWKSNQKTSGFLPDERAWMDEVFDNIGFVDAFRVVNQEPEQYTWWTQRSPTAFAKNVGWRIDYQLITPGLKKKVVSEYIYKEKQFSDHAPLVMEYKGVLS